MKFILGFFGVLLVFGLGVVVGRLDIGFVNLLVSPVLNPGSEMTGEEAAAEGLSNGKPADTGAATTTNYTTEAVDPKTAEAFRFSVANLPPAQQTVLRTLGVDGTEIIISQAMFACMQTSLSAARLEEIRTGATPSFTEAAVLVRCYTAN